MVTLLDDIKTADNGIHSSLKALKDYCELLWKQLGHQTIESHMKSMLDDSFDIAGLTSKDTSDLITLVTVIMNNMSALEFENSVIDELLLRLVKNVDNFPVNSSFDLTISSILKILFACEMKCKHKSELLQRYRHSIFDMAIHKTPTLTGELQSLSVPYNLPEKRDLVFRMCTIISVIARSFLPKLPDEILVLACEIARIVSHVAVIERREDEGLFSLCSLFIAAKCTVDVFGWTCNLKYFVEAYLYAYRMTCQRGSDVIPRLPDIDMSSTKLSDSDKEKAVSICSKFERTILDLFGFNFDFASSEGFDAIPIWETIKKRLEPLELSPELRTLVNQRSSMPPLYFSAMSTHPFSSNTACAILCAIANESYETELQWCKELKAQYYVVNDLRLDYIAIQKRWKIEVFPLLEYMIRRRPKDSRDAKEARDAKETSDSLPKAKKPKLLCEECVSYSDDNNVTICNEIDSISISNSNSNDNSNTSAIRDDIRDNEDDVSMEHKTDI